MKWTRNLAFIIGELKGGVHFGDISIVRNVKINLI
jgi:hypothetical protein